jgi:hypothetical protein
LTIYIFETKYIINRKKEGRLTTNIETSEQIYKSVAMSKYLCTLVIYNKFKSPTILTVIKVLAQELFVHVVRMAGESTVMKLLEGKPGGGREK